MSSPAALRAEAARKDELARSFDAEARSLPGLLAPVAARMGPEVWRGPAADAFTSSLGRWRGVLDREAESLHVVARRLRARADELRAEARRIEEAEAAAAAAAAEERRVLARTGRRAR
jgi:uncharacterized protein YukE